MNNIPGMLMTVAEAAELLRVSRKTVYRWIEEGKLRACVIRLPSGRIRIDREALIDEVRQWGLYWEDRRRKADRES